jgi:hypothetical protein
MLLIFNTDIAVGLDGKNLSAVLFVATIQCVVGCNQGILCLAGLSFDRVIVEYTHDEYCDILFTVDTCNICTAAEAQELQGGLVSFPTVEAAFS